MPAVGGWLAAVWTGASAAGAAGAAILKGVASVVLNMAVAKITAPKGPRPQELQNELKSSNAQRIHHLGRVRTGGAVMFWDWAHTVNLPPVLGIDVRTRRLYKLLAVADGGMTNVLQWYLDGEPVSVDADGYVTDQPWEKGNVRLQWRKGIQGDQWDGGDWPELRGAFPNQWTVNHRLRGVGTILATFDAVGSDDIAEVYSGGEPEVTALIEGMPAYWAFDGSTITGARNPPVFLSHIMANPASGPVSADDIDLPSLSIARNDCLANIPTVGGTRPRYLAGLSYAASDPIKDTAQKMLDAMGGRAWVNPEGKLAIEAGVWRAPTITIVERPIVEMEYGAGTERINRVTTLVATYVAPQTNWQETNADPVDDAAAIARWGEGEPKGIDLLAVQHHGQAAHLCKQKLALMNPARRMTVKLRAYGLRLIGERRVFVTIPRLGLNAVPFWIDALSFDGTNTTVELIEAHPGSFDMTPAEEGEPPSIPVEIDRGTDAMSAAITSLDVVTNDGDPYIRVAGNYTSRPGLMAAAQFKRSDESGPWTDMIREKVAAGYSFRTPALRDRAEYDVRTFVAFTGFGRDGDLVAKSPYTTVTGIEVVANGTAPGAPVVFSASGSAGGLLTVIFKPDLGANYHRTGLYRAAAGAPFSAAVPVLPWSYDTSSEVTMTSNIPAAGARYWLQSENASQVKSDPVLVGNYPA
ncbi:hypothetical protein [Paracoccus laeviglucosivorans]|uniref:Phage tail protein n=1 Tax=Paracoccus laeviglucosivorans TaxID=1197861 RepID=A0A521E3Y9_9RHOB|nr:hypothetical protein [Paracoccus laeviglucosivorans]SMO78659.1 hypothetical protein SAMN06265221_11143 [Paracoccus laeviglucosivorans]